MTATAPSALDRFLSVLSASPVARSRQRVVAGVCAGVAERTGVSVVVVRLLTVVLAVFGPGALLYLLAWLLLPAPDGRVRLGQALRDGDPASLVLLVVTALVLVPDALRGSHLGVLPVVAVGVLVLMALRGSAGRPWGCAKGRGQAATAVPPAAPGRHEEGTPAGAPSGFGYTGPDGRPQDAPR